MAKIEYLVTDIATGRHFPCRGGETLLEAASRHVSGMIRIGCRAGGCGMCKVQLLCGRFEAGRMSRAHISQAEEAEGFVLACRVRPEGNIAFRSDIRDEPSDSAIRE